MSTQNITDPILLDSTGQQILSAIQDLTTAVQPTNVYVDIASTLSVSGWSSAVPSVYTWTNSKVTGECAVEVFFSTGAESAPTPYIEYEKGVGSVIFYAPTGKPTVNLPVVIRIINAEAEIVSDIDADMVYTNAISGSSNVQEALTSVNSSLGTINSNINTLNAKTIQNTESFSTLSALKTFLANMTMGKSVNIIASSEASSAICDSTYICSGIATKVDSSTVDINWVRSNEGAGSTRYNISTQTFYINDLNAKITIKTEAVVTNFFLLYRSGNMVYATCLGGSQYSCDSANGQVKYNGTEISVPTGFIPMSGVDIRDTLNNRRITITNTGVINSNEAFSASAIRFTTSWMTSDAYPT